MFFARKKRQAALRGLIDELGTVRDQLRVLKLREAELREEVMTYRPGAYTSGDTHELTIKTVQKRRFDRMALPEHIRNNEEYWRTDKVQTMTLVPLDPVQRGATAQTTSSAYADMPIPEAPAEANYGQPLMPPIPSETPEPVAAFQTLDGPTLDPDDLDAILAAALDDVNEAAEGPAPFNWDGAPKRARSSDSSDKS